MKQYVYIIIFLIIIVGVRADLTINNTVYHAFNTSSDYQLDLTGNSNHATNNGAIYNTTGKISGNYYYITNKYMNMTDSDGLSLSSKFTINVWIVPNANNKNMAILSKFGSTSQRSYWFAYNNGLWNFFYSTDGSNQAQTNYGTTLSTGQWYMLTLTYDGAKFMQYINGVNVHNTTASNVNIYDSNTMTAIGRLGSTTNDYFDGLIDELSIWNNRVLNISDIQLLYNNGTGLSYPYTSEVINYPPSIPTFTYTNCSNITYLTKGNNDTLLINWTTSVDVNGDDITYVINMIRNGTSTKTQLYNGSNTSFYLSVDEQIVGRYNLQAETYDDYNGSIGNITNCRLNICSNNYVKSVGLCVGYTRLVTYTDSNNCTSLYNFPIENNTYEECSIPPTEIVYSFSDEQIIMLTLFIFIILSIACAVLIAPMFFYLTALMSGFLLITSIGYNHNPLIMIGEVIFTLMFVLAGVFYKRNK